MDTIASVSKGVFVFKNGFKNSVNTKGKTKKKSVVNYYNKELWYGSFKKMWNNVENQIEVLSQKMFSSVLTNLVSYIKTANDNNSIPTAALLTGVNVPDHGALFNALKSTIISEVTPHVAILRSEDCSNLKNLIQNFVYNIVNDSIIAESDDMSDVSIKKSSCTFAALEGWYEHKYPWIIINADSRKRKIKRKKKTIVVIMPDFECLNRTVLHDFILIISSYLNKIPITIVFGIATSISTLVNNLPIKVSTKLSIQIFRSQQSILYLNEILDNIFLSPECVFHLSGKPFTLLTDVFLFYDFSVVGFIQGIKFAMCEHFFANPVTALCCSKSDISQMLEKFTHADFEQIRRLPSFRPYVEAQTNSEIVKLLTDDEFLRDCLQEELVLFHEYLFEFHSILLCLYHLTSTLPKNPLGKQLREYYAIASTKLISSTAEFKECMELLSYSSKNELLSKISELRGILMDASEKYGALNLIVVYNNLLSFSNLISEASFEIPEAENVKAIDISKNRAELRQKLLDNSKQVKKLSQFDTSRDEFLSFLIETFDTFLKPPQTMPFHEIFFYNDVASLKRHIVGSPRAAVHTALNNPQSYLQCECCTLPSPSTILPTLPDLSIIYKLHLECGKLINMYDWLQAFGTILDPDQKEQSQQVISPEIQARFTRAVAELQFLGFIKTSKQKTDHVNRLTWGGC